MIKLFYKGAKQGLQISDLYKHLKTDDSEYLGDKLEKCWNKQVEMAKLGKTKQPSLLKAYIDAFFWAFMVHGIMQFILYAVLR